MIDKSELPYGIRKRLRDRKYLDSFKSRTCMASDYIDLCGRPSVGAHIRTGGEGGAGLKPDDDLVVALCHECHMDQEANPGPEWWIERVFKPMMRRQYRRWKNDKN